MTSNTEKAKILIVEDEVLIAADLESRLKKLGYTVCGKATSGEKALELAEQHQPDLVMMDIVIHGEMDGIEAAEVIRDKWGIPVVFLTAYADTDRLERAKLTYPFGYLLKPFQDRDLRITVEMALYVAKVDAERRETEESLRIHQIELEMQNEELRQAQLELEATRAKYFDLYNLAPVGYLTISEKEVIKDANLTSMNLFGVVKSLFVNQLLTRFIFPEDQDVYYFHRRKLFETSAPQVCEIRMLRGCSYFWARLESTISQNTESGKQEFHTAIIDITERKQAEEAVRESEEKYHTFFDNAPLGMFRSTPDGHFLEVNPALAVMLGYNSPTEVLDKIYDIAVQIYVCSEDRKQIVDENIQKNEITNLTNRYRRADGTEFIANLYLKTIRDNSGAPLYLQGIVEDITYQMQAEEALKESEEFYRLILSSITDAVFLTDDDGKFIFICPNVNHTFGFTEKEIHAFGEITALLGTDFIGDIDFDNQDEIKNIEKLIIDKYSEKHHLLINVLRVSIRQGSLLWICRDITERKKAQIELDKIKSRLESLWTIAKLTDEEYQVICDNILSEIQSMTGSQYSFFGFLNDDGSAMDIYSWSKEALAECQVIKDPIHFPIDKAGLWAEAIRHRRPLIQNDYNKNHKGKIGLPVGHVQIKNLATVPIFLHGKMISVAAVANKSTDYTEEDIENIQSFAINAQLILNHRESVDKLKKSEKEKEILLKEIHHRVKNNMQVIISLMGLQSDRITDEQLRTAFLESQSRIYAMSAVHEALYQSENLSRVDLAGYLSKLSEMTFQTYRTDAGTIQFIIDIDSIPVDLEKSYPIGLAINELLSNTLKYGFTDSQAGDIKITGELMENQVRLIVADTGVGIPEDFDWKNADSLGLQIVRTLVEDQLGGTIDLDRTNGAKWTITFPV